MNPALQGYLAAQEESLAEAGALGAAAAELHSVAELIDTSNELALAINDGSVPVAARRAVLDDLLEGRVRPEVRRLVHQAVTVVPASELEASFHWLAAPGADRRRARAVGGRRGRRRGRPRPPRLAQPGHRGTPPRCSRR